MSILIFKFSISTDAATGSFLQISGSFLQILNNTKRGGILPDTASRLCRKPAMRVSYRILLIHPSGASIRPIWIPVRVS